MVQLSIKQESVLIPPPPVGTNRRVDLWHTHSGSLYGYTEVRGEECWVHLTDLASFCFTRKGSEVAAAIAEGVDKELVLDAFRRRILPMAVQAGGREILHASAVRSPLGIVGLCGVSQTGKSTIAYGLSRRGYELWSDDALAFDVFDGKPLAISMPFRLRLRPMALALFGDHTNASPTIPSDTLPGSETAPLAALCLLRRSDDASAPVSIRRLSFAEAFPAALDHACWFTLYEVEDKRRLIDHYMNLAAEIPVFQVSFKSGLEHLPAILDGIEASLADT